MEIYTQIAATVVCIYIIFSAWSRVRRFKKWCEDKKGGE